MKRTIALLFIMSGIVQAEELTFPQAVDLMLRQNPALLQRKIESDISLKQWSQARAGYYPQVDFVYSWSRSNNPVYAFGTLLNQQRFQESDFRVESLNNPSPLTDVSPRFQVGWLLYDFGTRERRIDTAEIGSRIADLQQESARLALLQELVRRYYAVSLARQRLMVSEEAVVSAQSRMQQARDRAEEGLVVESDQLAAEVFHARRLQERIDAENQHDLARAALLEIIGGGNGESAATTSSLNEQEFPDLPLTQWIAEMITQRPELRTVRESSALAQTQVRLQKSSLYPSLQSWSGYEWHGDSVNPSGGSWGVGLELKWNLFRGFADKHQLTEAQLRQQGAEQKEREVENALKLQLQEAYYRFRSAKEKLAVARAAVEQAAASKRIYSDRYAAGLVTIQDSLQAETAYNEMRLLYSQNIYDLYVAYAGLLGAAGNAKDLESIGVPQ